MICSLCAKCEGNSSFVVSAIVSSDGYRFIALPAGGRRVRMGAEAAGERAFAASGACVTLGASKDDAFSLVVKLTFWEVSAFEALLADVACGF